VHAAGGGGQRSSETGNGRVVEQMAFRPMPARIFVSDRIVCDRGLLPGVPLSPFLAPPPASLRFPPMSPPRAPERGRTDGVGVDGSGNGPHPAGRGARAGDCRGRALAARAPGPSLRLGSTRRSACRARTRWCPTRRPRASRDRALGVGSGPAAPSCAWRRWARPRAARGASRRTRPREAASSDGRLRQPEHAPFDAIHVGAAARPDVVGTLMRQRAPRGS
jgi:hypothetical protein